MLDARPDRLGPAIARCPVPATWVAGERDEKFAAIAQAMAGRMPDAEAVIVPGAGHNVVFERPEAVLSLISTARAERAKSPT